MEVASRNYIESSKNLGQIERTLESGNNGLICCCCSKVLRRHMAHRPSTSFMSVLYNLAKWLFLYSVYFSSLFFFFFALQPFFFSSVHTQLFTIELFTMVLITCELIYIPIC